MKWIKRYIRSLLVRPCLDLIIDVNKMKVIQKIKKIHKKMASLLSRYFYLLSLRIASQKHWKLECKLLGSSRYINHAIKNIEGRLFCYPPGEMITAETICWVVSSSYDGFKIHTDKVINMKQNDALIPIDFTYRHKERDINGSEPNKT